MGASDKNGNHSQARTEQELNGCARRGLAMPRGSNSRYALRGLEDSHGSFPHRGHHGGFPQREKEWWIQNVLARDISQDGRVDYQGWCAAGRQGDHQGFLYGRRHGWRSCGFRCWRWWWRLPSVCDGSVHLHGNRAGYRGVPRVVLCNSHQRRGQKRASRDSTQEVLQSPSVKQPTGRPVAKKSMVTVLRDVHKEAGMQGLFQGVIPRIGLGIWQTLFMVTGANLVRDAMSGN